MLYCYVKKAPKINYNNRFRIIPSVLIMVGCLMIVNAIFPIIFYHFKSNQFSKPVLISPVESSYYDFYYNHEKNFVDLHKLFPRSSKITHYNLSIPKLKIENAVVQIGGENLEESLVQYPGTALPGEYGNVVIFGHSVLPQFFNPKNYKTIFSTLPNLKKGDEILIDFDGIRYRYVVVEMSEVSPDDVSILEQRYDGEYLSLVTCVPPGTYFRRLVVKAKLVPFFSQ